MTKVIKFPAKPSWADEIREGLKDRYGVEHAPEEVANYLESLIDEVVAKSKMEYALKLPLPVKLSQSGIDKINAAVNALVQNMSNHFRDQVLGFLIKEITRLRLKVYELEHKL